MLQFCCLLLELRTDTIGHVGLEMRAVAVEAEDASADWRDREGVEDAAAAIHTY